jgi:coatomer protein complex subunit alpha (xenin)
MLWTSDNYIIYNTHEHLKYLLLNGETGIIKSLDKIVFLLKKDKQNIFTLDFEEQLEELETDLTDLELKNALLMNDLTKVKQLIKEKKFLGNALTSFLLKKGYNSLALQLSKDPEVAFYLALSAGNLEKAFNISRELNSAEKYRLLSREAMRLGSPSLADMCLSLAGGGHRHLMHNLITGNWKQMEEFPSTDITHKFNNSLFTGDIRTRIKALSEAGQLGLAYATAKTHGVVDYVQYLKQAIPDLAKVIDEEENQYNTTSLEKEFLEEVGMTQETMQSPRCLIPVRPIVGEYSRSVKIMDNWPLFDVPEDREIFRVDEGVEEDVLDTKFDEMENDLEKDQKKDFGIIGGDYTEEVPPQNAANDESESDPEGMWGDDDSIDLGEDESDEGDNQSSNTFSDEEAKETVDVFITKDHPEKVRVLKKSLVAWEKFALGEYAAGAELLRNQMGLKSSDLLKKLIVELTLGSEVFCSNALNFSGYGRQMVYYKSEKEDEEEDEITNKSLLFSKYDLDFFKRKYQEALSLTSKAKFQKAKGKFQELLKTSVFARLKNDSEVEELKRMITAWTDYIFMINAKAQINKKTAPKRVVEVSLLMSLCRLEDIHRVLILKLVASNLYKAENYVHCLYVLRRFLGLVEKNSSLTKKETVSKMKKMQSNCEAKGGNKVNFEFSEKFLYSEGDVLEQVDYGKVTLHYGKPFERTKCPYDGSTYAKEMETQVCPMCQISELGFEAVGLKFF